MCEYYYHTDEDGITRYFRDDDVLHRSDGPAIEYPTGDAWWFWNGLLHRSDGPAIERSLSPEKEWWHFGNLIMTTIGNVTEKDLETFDKLKKT